MMNYCSELFLLLSLTYPVAAFSDGHSPGLGIGLGPGPVGDLVAGELPVERFAGRWHPLDGYRVGALVVGLRYRRLAARNCKRINNESLISKRIKHIFLPDIK